MFCCHKEFTSDNYKVRHHCHVTGKFIDACCNKCNLQLKLKGVFIPVIAHNMKRYDAHHIVENLRRKHVENDAGFEEVTVIPTNTEQFISFSTGKLRFLDSCQFLADSFDKLVETLYKSGGDKFPHTAKHIGANWDDKMIFEKGIIRMSS